MRDGAEGGIEENNIVPQGPGERYRATPSRAAAAVIGHVGLEEACGGMLARRGFREARLWTTFQLDTRVER